MRILLPSLALLTLGCGSGPPASKPPGAPVPAVPTAPVTASVSLAKTWVGTWEFCAAPGKPLMTVSADGYVAAGQPHPYTVVSEGNGTLTIDEAKADGKHETHDVIFLGQDAAILKSKTDTLTCRAGVDRSATATALHGTWTKTYSTTTRSETTYKPDGTVHQVTKTTDGGDSPGIDGHYRVLGPDGDAMVLFTGLFVDGKPAGQGTLQRVTISGTTATVTGTDGKTGTLTKGP